MIRNTLKPLNHYHLIVWLLAISAPIFLILEITRITFPSTKPTGCRKAIEAIAEAVYFPTPNGTVIPILQLFIYHLSYIFVTKTLYQLILSDYFPLDVFFSPIILLPLEITLCSQRCDYSQKVRTLPAVYYIKRVFMALKLFPFHS